MKDTNVCPHKQSGLCYRNGCIFIPQQKCMKKHEFDSIMKSAKKYLKKKKKAVKRYER